MNTKEADGRPMINGGSVSGSLDKYIKGKAIDGLIDLSPNYSLH